jgi:hypothetical protein
MFQTKGGWGHIRKTCIRLEPCLNSLNSILSTPSWTLTTIIITFHMMSHSSSPFSTNLVFQTLSEVHLKQEMRAQFAVLGLAWDPKEDVTPLIQRAPQALPTLSLLGTPAVQVLALEFSIPTGVFKEPTVTSPTPTPVKSPLAGGAQQAIDPCNVPLGVKQVGKRSLSGNADLSMFDILNTFHHCWFLSVDHLRAQAQKAQKAKDGNIFWVEFAPPFHTHLVKCAVAPVPWPSKR